MDIVYLVNYFEDSYQARFGIPHTPIPQFQIARFEKCVDELELDEDDAITLINAYFDTVFRKPVDYRFGHFASSRILEILFLHKLY